MKYILFEKSAIERLIRIKQLQSLDYMFSKKFLDFLVGKDDDLFIENMFIDGDKHGKMFVGKDLSENILVIDIDQCSVFSQLKGSELLIAIKKLFLFSIRYWNKMPFTNSEKIAGNKNAAIFLPFSKGEYRFLVARDPVCNRFKNRAISNSLLVFSYHNQAQRTGETYNIENYQKAGNDYLTKKNQIQASFRQETIASDYPGDQIRPITEIITSDFQGTDKFIYLPYEAKMRELTDTQREIVEYDDCTRPIRIEGSAGTGKTMALILRAIHILEKYKRENMPMKLIFLSHSKTTNFQAKRIFSMTSDLNLWEDSMSSQQILFTTLQDYCLDFVDLQEIDIADGDALESKQYQLMMIDEAYSRIKEKYHNTYWPNLSPKLKSVLSVESSNRISMLLQHEFSLQIKGYAEAEYEKYKEIPAIAHGLPVSNLTTYRDKEYIFSIFVEYQDSLQELQIFDTDDVVLEANFKFRGPVWRRERYRKGFDYIIIDEMHLFNENERQAFHYLLKSKDSCVPICFALDYRQAIGDQGEIENNSIENVYSREAAKKNLGLVFRSTQEIADLCSSIIASGAALFQPYLTKATPPSAGYMQLEYDISTPKLLMYPSDEAMLSSLETHVNEIQQKFHCNLSEIAIISFDDPLQSKSEILSNFKIPYTEFVSKHSLISDGDKIPDDRVIISTPSNVNGLEFFAVILVGVDGSRVPVKAAEDISANFLKHRALNELYIAISRAKYEVRILGNRIHGTSECLDYALNVTETLEKEDVG